MLTPQQASQKLADSIRTGQSAYTAGVQSVRVNPAEKAIAKRDKWVQAMTNPETHDKWERGLANTTLASWQAQTAGVGAQRYAQSADKAGQNYQAFATTFFPFLEGVQAQVEAMPDVTSEERIARMVANVRLIAQYRG